MEREPLKRRIKFLKSFKKDRNKLKYMQQCSNNCIEYICEACHNILRGNIKMPNSLRNKLKKHRKLIRQLANPIPKTSVKRKLLLKTQVGEGIFPVIVERILPYLINLLKKENNVKQY